MKCQYMSMQEGTLKVINNGKECIIKLKDEKTSDLYARVFLKDGEPITDSSRYFVLQIEENIEGCFRHALIGIGFR